MHIYVQKLVSLEIPPILMTMLHNNSTMAQVSWFSTPSYLVVTYKSTRGVDYSKEIEACSSLLNSTEYWERYKDVVEN